jgi:hypothetical protein
MNERIGICRYQILNKKKEKKMNEERVNERVNEI